MPPAWKATCMCLVLAGLSQGNGGGAVAKHLDTHGPSRTKAGVGLPRMDPGEWLWVYFCAVYLHRFHLLTPFAVRRPRR